MPQQSHIRTGQAINTYGVGSLVPLEDGGSAIIVGLDRWPEPEVRSRLWIHDRNLKKICNVDRFLSPPTGNEGGRDIPMIRFPTVVSCPDCKTLQSHKNFCSTAENECPKCLKPLTPSRFIVACLQGHLDDFPYEEWIHSSDKNSEATHNLSINSSGVSGALGDIEISCSCKASGTMEGIFRPRALEGKFTCSGKRPWLPDSPYQFCNQVPIVLQRGASNVWFPVVKSAISIPPWSESVFQILEKDWGVISAIPDDALEAALPAFLGDKPFSPKDVAEAVRARKAEDDDPDSEKNIKEMEFQALVIGKAESDRTDQFVCLPVGPLGPIVGNWFERIMEVPRLRVVQALESFTRVVDSSDSKNPKLSGLSSEQRPWLPAVQVIGEGVFLQIRDDRIAEWERRPEVIDRASQIIRNADPDRDMPITPRMILIHTLAHTIIDQWSLECGYPAADLKERLYVSDDMAGMLIYTSSSDSTGSLGGLVSQAEPSKLEGSISEALEKAAWCSSDPYCIETPGGFNSLNLGACHACLLLPEVSCDEMNSYLDRGLLIQGHGTADTGFFPSALGTAT